MLLALDQSWCIVSPKKTGTHSLVAMLAPTEATGNGYDFGRMIGGWHGFRYDGPGKRVLVIRHPLDRWASMLWYAKENGGPWGGVRDPETWAREWAQAREARELASEEWWISCAEIADAFQPHAVCRLEDGLENVFREIGMPHKTMWHRNANENRRPADETLAMLSAKSRSVIEEWAAEDLHRWY